MDFYNSSIVSEGLLNIKSFRAGMGKIVNSDSTTKIQTDQEYFIQFSGVLDQKIEMPDSTGLNIGHTFMVLNDSSKILPVYLSDTSSFLVNLYPTSRSHFILKDNSSSNGYWAYESSSQSSFSTSSFYGFYGGIATTGRHLVIYPGTSSDTAPYVVVSSQAIVALSIGSAANNTGTVGVFKTADLVNPIVTISLANTTSFSLTGIYYLINANDRLFMRVTSGTFSKPYVNVYLSGA